MRSKQVVIVIAALLLMALGLLRGEMLVVFRKASLLCLECIGIG